jgi:hypothetical protein
MKYSVIKKLLLLILSLSVSFSTNSYARNDQKGGHASSASRGGGGHGGGGRGGGGGAAIRGGGHASGFAHPSGYGTRVEHFRSAGAAPHRQTVDRSSGYSARASGVRSVARGNAVAQQLQGTTANRDRAIAPSHLTPQHFAGIYEGRGARNSSQAAAGTVNSRANANRSTDPSPQRLQAIANQKRDWSRWTTDNRAQIQRLRSTRNAQWSRIAHWWDGKNVAQTMHSDPWNSFRNNVGDFRNERRIEIWNDARWYHDNLFDVGWWAGCGWYPSVAVGYWNPWWWWTPCDWTSFCFFLGWGSLAPVYYDCGVNWVDAGQTEYFDGQPIGSIADSTNWATQLADPSTPPPAPTPPGDDQTADWKPLGVWALTQEEKGDAFMFMQLSVNKNGMISGAFANVISGEKEPVVGQIDKATQRAAFHFGSNKMTVIETGAYNLTQDVASCFVRFGTAPAQTWLMVRLPAPTMPNAPTQISKSD